MRCRRRRRRQPQPAAAAAADTGGAGPPWPPRCRRHRISWRNLNRSYIFFRFKLENRDAEIVAACCLRSKLYSILYSNEIELVKMKGQPQSSFRGNNINFKTFNELLEGKAHRASKYYKIGAKNHRVCKFLQRKRNLVSAFDDKRWLYNCMLHSLPYGSHFAIDENSKNCPFCKNKWKMCVCGTPKSENKYIYLKLDFRSVKFNCTWNS